MTSKPLDPVRSKQIAQQIKANPKLNFENSYKAALQLEDSLYVQGFMITIGKSNKSKEQFKVQIKEQPKEYSWLELDDCLIDLNLPNGNIDNRFYFAAQKLSLNQLKIAIAAAKEDYPDDSPLPIYGKEPYQYYGDQLLGGEEYQAAYQAAVAALKSQTVVLDTKNQQGG
jgi:hypothetical protein